MLSRASMRVECAGMVMEDERRRRRKGRAADPSSFCFFFYLQIELYRALNLVRSGVLSSSRESRVSRVCVFLVRVN